MTHNTPDIRLCSVWVKYTDGQEFNHEVWMDIDECVETQIRQNFETLSIEYPQIADFRWDLVRNK